MKLKAKQGRCAEESKSVNTACLPPPQQSLQPGVICGITGYMKDNYGGESSSSSQRCWIMGLNWFHDKLNKSPKNQTKKNSLQVNKNTLKAKNSPSENVWFLQRLFFKNFETICNFFMFSYCGKIVEKNCKQRQIWCLKTKQNTLCQIGFKARCCSWRFD